jgi:ferredoxin-NADP reductase/predicted pyridoxine 5'-phosphate oxidase superfamily flavin-nucleotide-binding protein
MASVSETNWPYVQHRGGPTGFLKIIDEKTIGFADYSGNRQYISTGNFRNNDRVSLFLMDYPNQTRLKILGKISIINGNDTKALASLKNADNQAPVERGFIIHIEAFDWNCPKYITPRYTEAQVKTVIEPIQEENKTLKAALQEQKETQESFIEGTLGSGPLKLIISGVRQLTARVRAFELRDPSGRKLPKVTAGSHIQVPVKFANGQIEQRHYSICSNPSRRDIYEIAVLNEVDGKGGSTAIYQNYQLGLIIECQLPENHFHVQTQQHLSGAKAILIAGGIGITPIKAIAQSLLTVQTPFKIHYAGKSIQEMAFSDRLQRVFGNALSLYSSKENQRMSISNILSNAGQSDIFYLCGPKRLIDAFIDEAKRLCIHSERLIYERFNSSVDVAAKPITVTLNKLGKTLKVKADETILDAMIAANIPALYSCKTGTCRTCKVTVLEGEVQHFDSSLSKEEQKSLMCPCVSRAETSHLILDI